MSNCYKHIGYCLGGIILMMMAACSKMDDTYKDFWKDGEIVYPEGADSLKIYPGKERIQLTWLILSDPTLTRAMIYWNNRSDSLDMPIQFKGGGVDTVKVMLADMPEGSYSFDIYTYDDRGNVSIPVSAVGRSYGDSYISTLLTRLTKSAFYADDSLKIAWGDPADETSLGGELVYMDTLGAERLIKVAPDADSTIILDYDFDASANFRYRTLFLPDSMSLDTFSTTYATVQVLGPPIELPKTGWIATASSQDDKGKRVATNAIDNKPNTIWVNELNTGKNYPHTLTVDMGEVQNSIFGVTLTQRVPFVNPLQFFDFQVSMDGIEWTSAGSFEMSNSIVDPQYFDLAEPMSFRYFRVICKSDYGKSANISLAEAGVYRR